MSVVFVVGKFQTVKDEILHPEFPKFVLIVANFKPLRMRFCRLVSELFYTINQNFKPLRMRFCQQNLRNNPLFPEKFQTVKDEILRLQQVSSSVGLPISNR